MSKTISVCTTSFNKFQYECSKHSAIVLLTGWLGMLYTIYSEKYVSTHVAFLSYNSLVCQDSKVSWTTHRDFLKWESWLSDILAAVFRYTSELGLWMTFIHRIITNIYPQYVANHKLTCIYVLRRKAFLLLAMNNSTLWPYFSPLLFTIGSWMDLFGTSTLSGT